MTAKPARKSRKAKLDERTRELLDAVISNYRASGEDLMRRRGTVRATGAAMVDEAAELIERLRELVGFEPIEGEG